jgi:Nif-specific regulatory protein
VPTGNVSESLKLVTAGQFFWTKSATCRLSCREKFCDLLQQQEFERVGGNKTIRTDVRVITATNLDLDQMVLDGEFREDLFYRLNGITINLPPLRNRGDDVSLLLEYYLRVCARRIESQRL